MTPARKAALQWFHDRGEVRIPVFGTGSPSPDMIMRMLRDHQLKEHRVGLGVYVLTLTDKGRRMLHGDAE